MGKRNRNVPLMLLLGMVFILYGSNLFARGDIGSEQNNQVSLLKTAADKVTQTMSNIGNWGYWINYHGQSAHDPFVNGSGGYYPRGTAAVLYMDGFIWGGYVRTPTPTVNPRVGGWGFSIGTQAGWIDASGNAVDPANPRVRTYRIRTDWETLTKDDVRKDASELNDVKEENVTESMTQAILDQYAADWNEWPVDLGAPWVDKNDNGVWDGPDIDEPGIANADQVVWQVINDLNSSKTTALYGSPPIGLEVQITLWQYNQAGSSLGQILFKKYKVINKSGFAIDSMFVSQFADPDLGNAADDYVGANVEKSLHYVYNAYATDSEYANFGLPPAAGGFDFFQGPIVPSVGDTAIFDLKYREGFKNLPMTSFGYFAAGGTISDPPMEKYEGTLQWYNMLNGYTPTNDLDNPTPYTHVTGPNAGEPTKFPLDGDPVTNSGDVDTNPGDRRMFACSGPFTLANGDTQEVVLALVGGIIQGEGGTNRNAVAQLLLTDDYAQFIYDNLFRGIPKPPESPKATATALEKEIVLNWGSDQQAVVATEADDPVLGFNFEGYNVYQLPSSRATISEGKKIATFDKNNGVQIIRAKKFLASFGDVVEVPVQNGTDSGIQRYTTIDWDYLMDRPLYQGNSYYYAVTAYNYSSDPTVPEPSLESSINIMTVVVQSTTPGVRYGADVQSEVPVNHVMGSSDGQIQVTVVDPKNVNGHEYKIFFTDDGDTNSTTYGQILWSVEDLTAGITVVELQPQTLDFSDNDQGIFDGLQVKVAGPPNDFKSIVVTANANGPLEEPFPSGFPYYQGGPGLISSNDNYDNQQANSDATWFLHQNDPSDGSYSTFVAKVTGYSGGYGEPNMGMAFFIPRDYEIRFTATGSKALYNWSDPVVMGTVPFEVWCVGDVNDPNDDYQVFVMVNDADENGEFNILNEDHAASGASNDPYTDSFYLVEPLSRDAAGYDALVAAAEADPVGANAEYLWAYLTDYDPWNCVAGFMRMVFVNWNGGDVSGGSYNSDMPEEGTVIRIITTKPITTSDEFSFTAPENTYSTSLAAEDVKKVNVFPNPYYAYNSLEENRFSRFVTFTHLPQEATLRIFNLAGSQVRKLEKNDPNQFLKWDLKNETELPVASGIYIIHVDMKKLGTKVLKLVVIQGEQILKYY